MQCTSENKHKCNVSHLIFIIFIFIYGLNLESQNKMHLGVQANWGKKKKEKKIKLCSKKKKKKPATNSSKQNYAVSVNSWIKKKGVWIFRCLKVFNSNNHKWTPIGYNQVVQKSISECTTWVTAVEDHTRCHFY